MAKRQQTEAEWWDEDAERLNSLCDEARAAGITESVGAGPSPPLNPDGSLVNDAEPPPPPMPANPAGVRRPHNKKGK